MYFKLSLIIILLIVILKNFNNFNIVELIITLSSISVLSLITIKNNITKHKLQFSIYKLLLEARDRDYLFEGICKYITSYRNFSTCWIGFIDRQGLIKPEFSHGPGIKFLHTININMKNGLDYLNSDNLKPKFIHSLMKFNYKDFHYQPITIGNRIIGLFVVYSNNISNDDRILLDKIILDLNEYMKKHKSFRIYRKLFEKNTNAIVITDECNNIVKVNAEFTNITGYTIDDVFGKNPKILSAGKHDKLFYNKMWESIELNGFWRGEIINKRKNGEEYYQHLLITNIYDEGGQVINRVANFYDVSSIKEKERQIDILTFHNPKTLLYNINYLNINYENIIKEDNNVAFCIIKINKFKISLGYETQNKLIKQITLRLKSNIRNGDILIHLDSDDFLIIITEKNINDINILCERLIKTSTFNYSLNDELLVNISINIGIAIYKINGVSLEEILEKAEIAANKSKLISLNSFMFYDHEMQIDLEDNVILMATELKNSIENKTLGVLYNPILDLNTNEVFALETMLYCDSPLLGRLFQNDFLQIANELGLIDSFEEFLFNEIFHDIINFKQFIPNIKIHIRLSNIKKFINYILNHSNSQPDFISLVVNEQTPLINEICALGIDLIINDFDIIKNNSLSLQHLPISNMYITEQYADTSNDNIIKCKTIINLAHDLKIKTIATGVTTKSEFEMLKNIHCDFIQGEYISQPLEKKELFEFFNNFI